MKPNTSRWRDANSYDFFDSLPIEGLAWECLRRSGSYQKYYLALMAAGTEETPFPPQAQRLWGLRFPGQTRSVGIDARRSLVTAGRSGRPDPDAFSGFPVIRAV
ncbi:transcriptional regulator domain-containing protein [Mesorhizobium sp. B1-1-8]|uniref:transcriptional regulator domain-containing protein n=1 Tax=Mesorhizobium sp. B1-1-8 TaxID=2589976 RepID=UPI001D03373A|nr:DUF6499 domain-containing protein [Mesorhizobium sp. B1-1-8]UCI09507.1 DUF6499 domain-containing protein [Mesorhizobium sp. B1-1-8]